MPDRKPRAPQGVIAVFIDDEGHVIATATDFERQGYGGFTLKQAQEIRAKTRLAHAVVNAYCSPQMVRAMESYDCEKLMRTLVNTFKCSVHMEAVNHGDE